MSSMLEKEWAAVDRDDKIVMEADTEAELRRKLDSEGLPVEDLEIVALPKSHNSLFL